MPLSPDSVSHLAERDFAFFYRVFLKGKMSGMHQEIIDAVMNDKRHLVVMAARGHFKTTLLSQAFPLWVCFRTPSSNPQQIIILSASMEQSTDILRGLKRMIVNSPVLQERLIPESLHDVKWSETQLEFKNGHRIMSVPFGDSVRGKHVNYCILDDVLTEETTNVEEAKNIFYGPVFPTVQAKRGKIIVVGTPMSYMDLLHDLAKPEKGFASMSFPAFKPDGSIQFPEHFDKEQLESIRRTMPSHLFSREYLLVPVSGSNALFPFDVREACRSIEIPPLTIEEEQSAQYVLGGDVAVSDKERGDFACYTVLKIVSGKPIIYYKKSLLKGVGTAEQGKLVAELHKQFNFSKILVEQTGLSYGVVDFLLHDDSTKYVTEGFNTTRKSKMEILGLLETTMRNMSLQLPVDDSLDDELSGWEVKQDPNTGMQISQSLKQHDDQVMSLAIAVFAASQIVGGAGFFAVDKPMQKRVGYKDINTIGVEEVFGPREDVFMPIGDGAYPSPEEAYYVG
jgi:hypothetical protein